MSDIILAATPSMIIVVDKDYYICEIQQCSRGSRFGVSQQKAWDIRYLNLFPQNISLKRFSVRSKAIFNRSV